MNLKNKTALITGTNRGIGKEIVRRFAEEGANVFAHARNENDEHKIFCGELSSKHNVSVCPVYFDANNKEQIKDEIGRLYKNNTSIDILVNNISIMPKYKLLQMTSIDEIKNTFEINYFSQIYITQLVSRIMKKNKSGSVINISSVAGIDGNGELSYVSSKAAIIAATKQMAIELGEHNIRVNSIAPGITDTDMGNSMSKDIIDYTLSHQIINHKATTTDIANMAVFLGSDLSKHITGQIIRVDGGMLK